MPSPSLSRRVIASFRVVVILAVLRNATVICRVCGIQASLEGLDDLSGTSGPARVCFEASS